MGQRSAYATTDPIRRPIAATLALACVLAACSSSDSANEPSPTQDFPAPNSPDANFDALQGVWRPVQFFDGGAIAEVTDVQFEVRIRGDHFEAVETNCVASAAGSLILVDSRAKPYEFTWLGEDCGPPPVVELFWDLLDQRGAFTVDGDLLRFDATSDSFVLFAPA